MNSEFVVERISKVFRRHRKAGENVKGERDNEADSRQRGIGHGKW